MGQKVSRQQVSQKAPQQQVSEQQSSQQQVHVSPQQGIVSLHNQKYKPFTGTPDEILPRFPPRHTCYHCRQDVENALNAKSSYPATFLRSKDAALEAAINGCKFYEWLLYFMERPRAPDSHGFYLQRTALKNIDDIFSVSFLIGTPNYTWPCAIFEVFTEAENRAASRISSRPFNPNFRSAASIETTKRWLEDCSTNHTECRVPGPRPLPTRLLYLGYYGDVRLTTHHHGQEEKFLDNRYSYAALSYCWGGDRSIKTKKTTIKQHMISIKVSSLGKTLQDAIEVALSLGIRFLWVDSLCIIQDDPIDMALEVARMSQYYEFAYVTVCASVASRNTEGFLAPRKNNPYLYGPFELPYRSRDEPLGSIKLVQYRQYSKEMEPATSRAWIMQESLLACRVLSYSYQSVAWSCRKVNHSDGGPTRDWYNFEDRRLWAQLHDETRMKNAQHPIRELCHLIESYTLRNLTDPKDRLPAISGIAHKYVQILEKYLRIHSEWHDLTKQLPRPGLTDFEGVWYVAGLWYCKAERQSPPEMFFQQLLWSTSYYKQCLELFPGRRWESEVLLPGDPPELRRRNYRIVALRGESSRRQTSSRSVGYLAPSWSWAAIEAPINYECKDTHLPQASKFEVLACETSLELSEASFGNVTFGHLIVNGLLIPLQYGLYDSFTKKKIGGDPGEQAPLWFAWKIVHKPDTTESAILLSQISSGSQQGWILQVTGEADWSASKPIDPNWTANSPKGLVLVADGAHYRRIGLCSIQHRHSSTGGVTEALLEAYGSRETITII